MLTRKQHELLIFIHEKMKETGIPPSFDEMKDALDLASKSGIHRLITALEERGFIHRLPNRARAMEVLRLPEAVSPLLGATKQSSSPSLTKKSLPRTIHFQNQEQQVVNVNVPLMGRIAAGVPISAIQQQTNTLSLPPDMISSGEHYALEVKGDSMIGAGIFDGDTVIIRQVTTALPGDIIVALIDEEEATLKKYRRNGNSVALEAANPAYETRFFEAHRIRIQGKLSGLIRRY